jgi:hypothetical protein
VQSVRVSTPDNNQHQHQLSLSLSLSLSLTHTHTHTHRHARTQTGMHTGTLSCVSNLSLSFFRSSSSPSSPAAAPPAPSPKLTAAMVEATFWPSAGGTQVSREREGGWSQTCVCVSNCAFKGGAGGQYVPCTQGCAYTQTHLDAAGGGGVDELAQPPLPCSSRHQK